METNTQPKIFLSYARANKDVADEIDNYFEQFGITFQRDVRDINYTDSVKDFMNRIDQSDFVVMLISDEYIKSENCMYEVTALLGVHGFEKKILPIVVNDASIFKRDDHRKYYEYWNKELQAASELNDKYFNEKTLEAKKKIQSINNSLGLFFRRISNMKILIYENIKKTSFDALLEVIGMKIPTYSKPVSLVFDLSEFDTYDISEVIHHLSTLYNEISGDVLEIKKSEVLEFSFHPQETIV